MLNNFFKHLWVFLYSFFFVKNNKKDEINTQYKINNYYILKHSKSNK